uniref:Ig-like domain-containing protein n=1 Tax=Taeniopygia guttata TaxID=59729 RepID=H0ZY44_TAEGU
MDFIFRLGSRALVVADGAAWMTWVRPGRPQDEYLEHTYVEWLEKISWIDFSITPFPEPPDAHVYRKVEHGTRALSCHMYGFCPRTIRMSWMKGEEMQDQEIELGGIIPNSNGTFHTWARAEALPGEREQHWCRVEHPRMLELGILIWGKAGNAESVIGNLRMRNLGMQSIRVGTPLLTILPFPELESSWNLILVMVAVSVIAMS